MVRLIIALIGMALLVAGNITLGVYIGSLVVLILWPFAMLLVAVIIGAVYELFS
jgi:hypothetical protein